jgi:Family of unknown function (DUF6263)
MQKPVALFFLFFLSCINLLGQKVSGNLQFKEGKTYIITTDLANTIAQQTSGQPVDFSATGKAIHSYKVINTTPNSSVLQHKVKGISFVFEGMGKKRAFDTDNEKDMENNPGPLFKEILEKSFSLIIDPSGKTLNASPEKIELTKQDESMVIIMSMLRELTGVVYPPKKGDASFFRVLPAYEIGIGDTWTDSLINENEKTITTNTLSAITDSTIVVSFKTISTSKLKIQMMGMDATSAMNSTADGTIILDRLTGIIREKTSTIDANGTTQTTIGTMPTTGKITITTIVREEE